MEESVNTSEGLVECFKKELGVKAQRLNTYSPLTLAYIGDSVFDLLVKTYFVSKMNMQANKYHKLTSNVVKAKAQADMLKAIEDDLSEEELDIYKRGRNSHPYNKAKNASRMEYLEATGFEALVGYLYLDARYERLVKLLRLGFERTGVVQ
ncbi:MAG: ribonuclease III [Lachnospiraceae bacterium]|nr:ribonuclease III [Lachnospiraceae bacterium]